MAGLFRAAGESVRRLSAIVLAAAVCGVLIGGVGGRLAMLLLARLNPEVSGTLSDDGFVMGRFTVVATLNLLVAALFLGIVGALVYAVVRGLRIGPWWFQVLSVGVGRRGDCRGGDRAPGRGGLRAVAAGLAGDPAVRPDPVPVRRWAHRAGGAVAEAGFVVHGGCPGS